MKTSQNKYGALIKDTLLFALSTFVPKAISFFLVPIYTNCLTTAEFGLVDVIMTTVSLLVPILTLGIDNAVLRFTIESKADKKPYQIAFKLILVGVCVLLICLCANMVCHVIELDAMYQGYFLLNYLLTALYGVNVAYLRATEKVALLSTISIVNTLVTVVSNIVTLVIFKWGVFGYLISSILGFLVVNVIIFYKINVKDLLSGLFTKNSQFRNEMIKYSSPLVASGIAWWANSASDRYFVTYLCGVDANGIYSVAYKIPTILQMIQSVFSQAWLLSIYREYNTAEGKNFVSKIYDLYNGGMTVACAFLILLTIPLAKFLYAKDFYAAWEYVPALLISVVFIANAGFFESMLTLYKKSNIVAVTTVIGAICNIILNYVLISNIGVQGAAIATTIGYFIMWILRVPFVHGLYPFKVNWFKQGALFTIIIVEAIIMITLQNYLICAVLCGITVLLNINNIKYIIDSLLKKILKK